MFQSSLDPLRQTTLILLVFNKSVNSLQAKNLIFRNLNSNRTCCKHKLKSWNSLKSFEIKILPHSLNQTKILCLIKVSLKMEWVIINRQVHKLLLIETIYKVLGLGRQQLENLILMISHNFKNIQQIFISIPQQLNIKKIIWIHIMKIIPMIPNIFNSS